MKAIVKKQHLSKYGKAIESILAHTTSVSTVDKNYLRSAMSALVDAYGAEMFNLAMAISTDVLNEKFGWGTGEKATRLSNFYAYCQADLDDAASRFDEDALSHFLSKCESKGIKFATVKGGLTEHG